MGSYAEVEAIIQAGLETTAPAVALAVYYKGSILTERAYGYLDPDTRMQPVQHDTLFDLASVSKLYTVSAFLGQVAEGRIGLNDPVVRVLPDFGKYGPRPIEGGQNPHTLEREPAVASGMVDPATVTFRHLLTHTSGLAPWRDLFLNLGPIPPAPGTGQPVDPVDRLAKALDLIASYPYVSQPGARVNYSDLGLIVLGAAVVSINSNYVTVADAVYDVPGVWGGPPIFNPPHTLRCVPTEYDARWRQRRCQGEVHDENACALGGIAGHAGLFGAAADVMDLGIKWLYALAGRFVLPQELAQQAVQEQASTGGERRGLGWALKSAEGSSAGSQFSPDSFGHTGFTGTSLWIDPQRELVVALLTNRVYYGRDHTRIAQFRPAVHDAVAAWVDSL